VVDGASLTAVMLFGGATAAVTVCLVVVAGNLTKLDA
jgi:hypothetical protein